MQVACRSLLIVAAALSLGSCVKVTPIEKVITLLKTLQTDVQGEGKTEAATYDTFACFCKDTTKTKSTSISDEGDKIDGFAASIQEDTATKEKKHQEVLKRLKKQEELAEEYREIISNCLAKTTGFEAKMADLSKAVDSLEKAIAALDAAKPASFLSMKQTLGDSLAIADALGLTTSKKSTAMAAFIQSAVDPDDPEYKFHSSEIFKLLKTLETDFNQKKTDTQKEWDESKKDCDDLKSPFSDEMKTNAGFIVSLKSDIDGLSTKIAKDRGDLVQSETTLKEDQTYLKDLTSMCEEKATQWDQRASTRDDELKTIAEALTILEEGKDGEFRAAKDLDEAVNPTMLQKPKVVPSFLQLQAASHLRGQKSSSTSLRNSDTSAAVQLLGAEADRLNSPTLSALAKEIRADPFGKVKYLITKLIAKLLDESAQEATKKGFCDSEIAKAKGDRDWKMSDIAKLTAILKSQEAEKKRLDQEIKDLKKDILKDQGTLNTTIADRKKEKGENEQTLADANEGVKAISEAIRILRTFYDDASSITSASLSQQKANPVDADSPGAGFDTTYQGSQAKGGGIITLLETIRADFEKSAKQTEDAENKAHRAFVELSTTMKVTIKTDETAVEQDEEDVDVAKNTITQKTDDLDAAQSLLDDALKTLEDLKPMCIDTGMAYSERVEQREEEIAALNKALCYLDPEKTEDDCK